MRKIGFKVKALVAAAVCAIAITPFVYAFNLANAQVLQPSVISAPVRNKDYQSTIDKAKETMKEYQNKAEDAKKDIANLTGEYNSIVEYIRQLDEKQDKLYAQVSIIEYTIKSLEVEKEETEKKLEEAIAKRDEQYATMSKRIKYVYENGTTSYLDIILNAGSLADMLNRVEYVSKISDYDNKLFTNFKQTALVVSEYNDMLDAELEAIDKVQETYDYYVKYSEELAAAKEKALDDCAAKLQVSKETYKTYLYEIETQQMTIQQAEEAMRQAALQAQLEAQMNQNNNKPAPNIAGTGANNAAGITLSDASSLGELIWPLPGYSSISSKFGYRVSPTAGASSNHRGIDIPCKYGTQIVAAGAGTVVAAARGFSEGNYVMIQHADGNYTIYMHCSSLAVSSGQYVKRGQVIAYAGSTGVATGVHLHFGVNKGGSYVNPLSYVAY